MQGRQMIIRLFLLFLVPCTVSAFSISNIEVDSVINERLNGEIPFHLSLNEKPSDVYIKLASSDTYKAQNITRQTVLDSVAFKRVGTSIIFFSKSKVTKPVLDLLVEINSGSEKKIRHYKIVLSDQVSRNKISTNIIKALKLEIEPKNSDRIRSQIKGKEDNTDPELIGATDSLSVSHNPNQELKASNDKPIINVKAGIASTVSSTDTLSNGVLEKMPLVTSPTIEPKVEDLSQLLSRIAQLERSITELKNEAIALSTQQQFSQGQQAVAPLLANTEPVAVIHKQDQVSSNRIENIKPIQSESIKEQKLPPPKKKSSLYIPFISVLAFIFVSLLGWIVIKKNRIKGKSARTPSHAPNHDNLYPVGKEIIHSNDDFDINIIDLELSAKEKFFIDDIDIQLSDKDKNHEDIEIKNDVIP